MVILQKIGELIRTRYYSIMDDFEFQEVEAIASSQGNQVQYWVIEYYGKHFRPPFRYLYEYEILDNKGKTVAEFNKNGWTLIKFNPIGATDTCYFRGIDPNGRVFGKGIDKRVPGIVKSLLFLNELSTYKSWEEYQLLKENDELRKKLEQLHQEKKRLQSMLGELE